MHGLTRKKPGGWPAAETAPPWRGRDLRLDFFRGIALFLIFIDHIPENVLSYFTLPSVGFSDAAEVFIFISGYTAALVYGRALLQSGPLVAGAQIYRRVWQLYVAHVFLFVIYIAEVSYSVLTFNNPMYNDESRVGDFLAEPHIAIIKALLLQFQPTFLDILPLYIVLLAGFPIVIMLMQQNPIAALLPAFALYLATHLFGLSLHGFPEDHIWFFNPLAWQLLFVIGAACGFARITGRRLLPESRAVTIAAAAFVAAAIVINVSWTVHGAYDAFPAILLKQIWPINKTNLAPLRLLHFLALAVVVVHFVTPDSRLLRLAAAQPVIRCGQQSLHIFCLGILLSMAAHFALTEWSDALPTQLAVNAAGIAIMIGAAALMTWYRSIDPARTGSGGAGAGAAKVRPAQPAGLR